MKISKFLPAIFLFCLSANVLSAQKDTIHLKGEEAIDLATLAISDAEMIDLLMPVMPGVGSASRNLVSEKTLKPYMMPPRKLGENGSLNAYALTNLMEYYVNFDNNFKDNLSPDYISLSTQSSDLPKGLEFLAVTGTVSAAIMPYDASKISTAVYATQKYKIRKYLKIFSPSNNPRERIFETKKALMKGNPVLVKMMVDKAFIDNQGNKFWDKPIRNATEEVAMIVVGYSHDLEAFEIMGIWGKEWADSGYLFLDYDDYSKVVKEGIVIIPDREFK